MDRMYKPTLSLMTDLYELTMAYGYWKSGKADEEAVFQLFFRSPPFGSGYVLACGLEQVVEYLERFRFDRDDLDYLASLTSRDGSRMFEQGFLDHLSEMRFSCDVRAIPEGSVAFPQEPLLRVQGPMIQAQILESALLNIVNFQTLIATKAARIAEAAGDSSVVEFGLRRAQGIDGGLSAARAAYIGGCAGTSNVLAGQMLGVPVKGTHAHSWVMSFENERDAFFAYARAMPENCILLVDTYDTIQGIANAIEVGKWLRENGHQLTGIRLDSGDLSQLSKQGRKMLDEAGLDKTVILASGDLDEYLITSLNRQQAPIDLWGVGTKLVTAFDEPALGGVYKLSASRQPGGQWQHRIKVSEQTIKSNVPGLLNVRRFVSEGMFVADMIYDELQPPQGDLTIVDPADSTQRRSIPSDQEHHDVLVPVFEQGQCVYQSPSLKQLQERAHQQRTSLHPAIRRFENPHRYDAGLEASLFDLRQDLIVAHRSE